MPVELSSGMMEIQLVRAFRRRHLLLTSILNLFLSLYPHSDSIPNKTYNYLQISLTGSVSN